MNHSKRPRPRKRRAIALQNLKIKKVTLNKSSLSNSSFHQGLAETSTLPSCSVDSFPMDNERREAWRFALNINSEDIFKYSRVCHLHFNGDAFDYEKSPFSLSLKKNAIPSERVALSDIQCSVPDIRPSRPKLPPNSPTIKNDSVTETQDSNISSDQEEVVDSETIDPLRSSVPSPKPRTSKRSYTTDPILEKAQNLLSNFGKEMKNEYASFGEHIANKLRKYDDYIRSEAEMKIMQILYECDMQMYKKRRLCTCTLLESPDTNS
ncbi:uncharacterized protein [Diabrotica undecimpunctata]|uniref:uncharacterized protein isoform X3 n=1 Tax=Diabrotica undecimpunctata TaxID=50387 RepID=UPI003B63DAAE